MVAGEQVRAWLRAGQEVALVDVREEAEFAVGHPLWAANFPLSRVELDAWRRLPRRDVTVVVYGEGLVDRGVAAFKRLGYTDVQVLDGDLTAWVAGGGELFIDVNAPSKAFGELVEHERATPFVTANELDRLLAERADVVVVDARRLDEYRTMSVPGATSLPGAELVLRIRELAPDPGTHVVVNCAGRTRSIIGTQSLINAGLPNRVTALRNGTIGWTLAGLELVHGADRQVGSLVSAEHRAQAAKGARDIAERAGVRWTTSAELPGLDEAGRTTYRFDVRTPEEYVAGHLPGFLSAPGGQLVQETDHFAPVRGARVVLADDDGVRATMTASWLAQMGWEVHVVDAVAAHELTERGAQPVVLPDLPPVPRIGARELADRGEHGDGGDTVVVDVGPSRRYAREHVPGAWFAVRAQVDRVHEQVAARRYAVVADDEALAVLAAHDLQAVSQAEVAVLAGGHAAWQDADLPVEVEGRYATPPIDRYRRPYEGTDVNREAMEAYLEWEYGLVEQLRRDGTHGFVVA